MAAGRFLLRGCGWLTAAALLAGAVACSTVQTTNAGVVGVDREQRMSALVSEEDLRAGAAQAYKEVVGKARAAGTLDTDPALAQRVRTIASRLIAQAPAFRPDAAKWPWEVNVIRSDDLNAWCMPGGKIAVYSGLVQKLSLTDDEIAAVLGHEIAHALREHARERASEALVAQLGIGAIAAIAGASKTVTDMAQTAYDVTATLPHSRLHESEADRIGVELAARAGYDPRAAITLWQKMAKATSGKGGPEFLSTHPSADTRLKDLEVYAMRVQPLYEQARRRR